MPSEVTERPAPDTTAVRSRRAFARRQWARRWLTWKYVLLGLLLAGALVGTVWLVWFSSYLSVRSVEVSGADRLGNQAVLAAAEVPEGEPLARVDVATVQARVQALADIRSAEVTRTWPDRVQIDVEERVSIAVVDIAGQTRGMDAEGVVFRTYPKPPPGLPQVRTSSDTRSDALREAALVVESLPDDITSRVDHVEVGTIDQISLVLRDGRTVVWGSAEESEAKSEVLTGLLRQPARTYDVSVPGQPTTQG